MTQRRDHDRIVREIKRRLAKTHWICSFTESTECSEGVECGPPEFNGVTSPTFRHLDIK